VKIRGDGTTKQRPYPIHDSNQRPSEARTQDTRIPNKTECEVHTPAALTREKTPGTRWIGAQANPREGLDRESNTDAAPHRQSLY
jgi:hypothetical protein